jgi:cytidine deaminase
MTEAQKTTVSINLWNDGDAIRDSISRGDAVVLLGISKIQDIREENQPAFAQTKRDGELAEGRRSSEIRPLNRRAYIFHSLKHPEEVRTLRRVYGAAFIAISVYSPRSVRKQALCERIARSRKEYNSENLTS